MNFLFKRGFIVMFVPGFLFSIGLLWIYKNYNIESIFDFGKYLSISSGIGIVVFSFIFGQIFDSIRDCGIENCFKKYYKKERKDKEGNRKKDINWEFFSEAPQEEIEKLDSNFYVWYTLNFNLLISFFSLLLLALLDCLNILNKPIILILIFFAIIVLGADSFSLRKEISNITQNKIGSKENDK